SSSVRRIGAAPATRTLSATMSGATRRIPTERLAKAPHDLANTRRGRPNGRRYSRVGPCRLAPRRNPDPSIPALPGTFVDRKERRRREATRSPPTGQEDVTMERQRFRLGIVAMAAWAGVSLPVRSGAQQLEDAIRSITATESVVEITLFSSRGFPVRDQQ